jgi:hypothetical protein
MNKILKIYPNLSNKLIVVFSMKISKIQWIIVIKIQIMIIILINKVSLSRLKAVRTKMILIILKSISKLIKSKFKILL